MLLHAVPHADVLRTLAVDENSGLSDAEVTARRTQYGSNSFSRTKRFRPLGLIFEQLKSPLILILIVAGCITFFLKELADTLVILAVVIINTGIGYWQEGRAKKAFERLSESYKQFAVVLRGGTRSRVPAHELVPGDIVLLSQGASIPADGRVLFARGLEVNESALTGEWQGVTKKPGMVSEESRITERSNMVYLGTTVSSGEGRMVVTETGETTELGKIAETLADPIRVETPFQASVAALARTLGLVVLAFVVLILLLGVAQGEEIAAMLLLAVAVAVAAIPEGLPVAVTTTLAIGLESILSRGGLVRQLVAAETLGTTTVILTDKTGTLTEANIGVSALYPVFPDDIAHEQLLHAAVLATDAFTDTRDGKVYGQPIERAVVRAAKERGIDVKDLHHAEPRLDYLPFDAVHRFAASLHKKGDVRTIYVSGAPETILGASTALYRPAGGVRELSATRRKELVEEYEREARAGKRMIAVASKTVSYGEIDHHQVLSRLTLRGFIALDDPIRRSAPDAVKRVQAAGAKVIMATGDNAETARRVALQVGIAEPDSQILTGDEFEKMTPTERSLAALRYSVFARMLPEQKKTLLSALQHHGEVVAMTGDGVNDAPALISADIGIALGSGTDVAKESADVVLLHDDFSVIVAAIEEGRKILDNLKKVVVHLVSTGFSEIVLVLSALVLGLPLPILPTQILWHNVLSEGFLTMAFAFEPAERGIMRRRPEGRSTRILSTQVKGLIVFVAICSGLMISTLYLYLLSIPGMDIVEIRSAMFASLTMAATGLTFSIKNLREPLWRVSFLSNLYLVLAFLGSLSLLFAAFTVPFLTELLHLEPLSKNIMYILVLIGFVNVLIVETGKRIIFRTESSRARIHRYG